jgi:hypothetical protein
MSTAIHIATKAFRAEIDGETIDVAKGERVIATHELIRRYPEHFRGRGLSEELQIRSDRVEELNEQATRTTASEPVSRAGIAEREQERFWTRVDKELHRDDRSSEERREQTFYDEALRQVEDAEAARMRDDAIAIGEAWHGRLGG